MFHLRLIRWRTARRSRKGLTLLELVVVMAVLVGLVGVLVPLLPNLLYSAHTANGATNISELQKALETYQSCNLKYPDGYDSLLGASGTVPMSMMWMAKNPTPAQTAIIGAFTPYTLTATDVTSLSGAGITTVYSMDTSTGASATFPGTVTPGVALAVGTKLVSVSTSLLSGNLSDGGGNPVNITGLGPASNFDPAFTYVALGVGANCSIVGAADGGVVEAPIRGQPNSNADLNKMYGRYVAIYKVDTAGGSAATLVGCGCPGGNGLGTVEFLTYNYYNGSH
jgi:type II secretory pathway pseudopilin PulG